MLNSNSRLLFHQLHAFAFTYFQKKKKKKKKNSLDEHSFLHL